MKKVAIVGTVGVPACYGGYETLVENLLDNRLHKDIKYQVYCSSKVYKKHITEYKGAKLIHIPLQANGWQSVFYDSLSLFHAYRTCHTILSLGTVGSFVLPLLRFFSKKRVIINLDGLDNRRDKFNSFSQRMIGYARRLAAKYADVCISDNQGIKDYVKKTYHRDAVLIEYGGDNAFAVNNNEKLYEKYGLIKGTYCFKVARIEPENNIEMILEAFVKLPQEKLVIVGNWNRSEFGQRMKKKYDVYQNIKMYAPIYEAEEINLLRSNCKLYIHGHSAGGTNPSLVEAMYLHLPIIAFNVVYNRETTENKAVYFNDTNTLVQAVKAMNKNEQIERADFMKEIADRRYKWDLICQKYETLLL
ncbi:DUF1972 domain-containing protein [Bacteroides sp.]|uniref:DUF1972 domain-containing protein n=1 Tax=Bacteroides sp. TaxID=29523 RepID=UPI003AB83657